MKPAFPLPPVTAVRPVGYGRARKIRFLYGERCSVVEIAAMVQAPEAEVRRTLLRPVKPPMPACEHAYDDRDARRKRSAP